MTAKKFLNIAASALLLAVAVSMLGSPPARAADAVKSPRDSASGQASGKRDSASGQATGRRQYNPIILTKYDEVLAKIAELSSDAAALQALCDELNGLVADDSAAMAQDGAAAEEMLQKIDDASRVFDEQVLSLLDEAAAKLVHDQLAMQRQTYSLTPLDGDSGEEEIAALLDALATITAGIPPIEVAAQQGKTTQVTRSNISNN